MVFNERRVDGAQHSEEGRDRRSGSKPSVNAAPRAPSGGAPRTQMTVASLIFRMIVAETRSGIERRLKYTSSVASPLGNSATVRRFDTRDPRHLPPHQNVTSRNCPERSAGAKRANKTLQRGRRRRQMRRTYAEQP